MKKPSGSRLRARGLDQQGLAKARGGRGTCHGYYECNFCHVQTGYSWDFCPNCGKPFRPEPNGRGGMIP